MSNKVNTTEVDWQSLVLKADPDYYKPRVAYAFSHGREFTTTDDSISPTITPIFNAPLANDITASYETGQQDGVFVRASTATYTHPTAGLITTAATDEPRFEEHGLLHEGSATNLVEYSHELDNAWWTETRSTVSADAITGPDGANTADGLIASSEDNFHGIYCNLSPWSQNEKIAASCFLKSGAENWIYFTIQFWNTDNVQVGIARVFFDLFSGVAGTTITTNATVHNCYIDSAANGFYRCKVTVSGTSASIVKVRFNINFAEADNDLIFAGDDASITVYATGMQAAKEVLPSSYIPTSGSTITRATEAGYPQWIMSDALQAAVSDKVDVLVKVRFPFDYDDISADDTNLGLISLDGNAQGFLYLVRKSADDNMYLSSYDGTTTAEVQFNFSADTDYWVAVRAGYTVDGNKKFKVGYATEGGNYTWSSDTVFDGAFDENGLVSIGQNNELPFYMKNLRIWWGGEFDFSDPAPS